MKILITSGGTKISIDEVRYISNMSQGTFGTKIAIEAMEMGHDVIFLRAEKSKSPFIPEIDFYNNSCAKIRDEFNECRNRLFHYQEKYAEFLYKTFDDYAKELERVICSDKPDMVILAAAVSDYGTRPIDGKVRSGSSMNIELFPLPKLISKVKEWMPETFLVGFKLLVGSTQDELLSAAKKSIEENRCNLIVANDLSDIKSGQHKILLVDRETNLNNCEIYSIDKEIEYMFYNNDTNDTNYLARKVIERAVELKGAK